MKMFWWQGGLHIAPETKEESGALEIVANALHGIDVNERIPSGPIEGKFANENAVVGVHELPKVVPNLGG
jgi:hypothetical protein